MCLFYDLCFKILSDFDIFFLIERQSSFFPLLNLWCDGYTVFESTTKSGFYLRAVQRRLVMEQYDGTEKFKQEASFKTHKTITTGIFKIKYLGLGQI